MGRGGLAAEGEWGLRSTGSMGLNATGSTGSTGSSRDRSPQFASSILEFGRTLERDDLLVIVFQGLADPKWMVDQTGWTASESEKGWSGDAAQKSKGLLTHD